VPVSVSAVHQFVATAEAGAAGAHTLLLRDLLRQELGVESEIFTEHVRPPFVGVAHDYREYGTTWPARPTDVLVYQFAIGSVVADTLMKRAETLVVNYHNLTPARYLRCFDPDATHGVNWGRRQLASLASRSALGLAVSRYNERDLRREGFSPTAVAPVLFSPLSAQPDPQWQARLAELRSRGPLWLFVGRLAAHKCQHHLIRALAAYRKGWGVDAHLLLVGGPTDSFYVRTLKAYCRELEVEESVVFSGPLPEPGLAAAYMEADVMVCLSEHEGFCVPLVEAMAANVPVVALGSSAVPETVQDAAILLRPERPGGGRPGALDTQPSPLTVAAACHKVITDQCLRAALRQAGHRRAERFALARTGPENLAAMAPALES